jgi:hypothetical protein
MDWKNPDEIEVIEGAGVGSTVEIRNEKDGRYWNVTGAEVVEPGDGVASVGTQKEKAPAPKEEAPASNTKSQRPSQEQKLLPKEHAVLIDISKQAAEALRLSALKLAVSVTDSVLCSDERFKKLLPAGKVTGEIVMQTTLENASQFELFLKGELDPNVSSDTEDLDSDPVDADEPELPGDMI